MSPARSGCSKTISTGYGRSEILEVIAATMRFLFKWEPLLGKLEVQPGVRQKPSLKALPETLLAASLDVVADRLINEAAAVALGRNPVQDGHNLIRENHIDPFAHRSSPVAWFRLYHTHDLCGCPTASQFEEASFSKRFAPRQPAALDRQVPRKPLRIPEQLGEKL